MNRRSRLRSKSVLESIAGSLTRLRATILLGCSVALMMSLTSSTARPQETTTKQLEIQLTIDYGDGFQKRFTKLKWSKGMSVMGALEAASRHKRGIRPRHRGTGDRVFIYQIDDLENEAGGRAWLFYVNEKQGDRSAAVYPLKAGDTILWEFGTY